MLFFPISSDTAFGLYAFGSIAILSTIYTYKKKTYKSYYIFWISLILTLLYRLDVGMAFGISAIIVLLLMYFINSKFNKSFLIKFTKSFIFSSRVCILLFLIICLFNNINPFSRALEFISIANSNINWSYASWGDANLIAYSICYIILPIIMVFMLIYSIYKKVNLYDSISDNHFIILMTLGISYILNLGRGIVRHSLFEGLNLFLLSTSILFISLFVYFFNFKKKIYSFIICEVILLVISNLLLNPHSFNVNTLANNTANKFLDFSELYDIKSQENDRVILSKSMENVYVPLKNIFH